MASLSLWGLQPDKHVRIRASLWATPSLLFQYLTFNFNVQLNRKGNYIQNSCKGSPSPRREILQKQKSSLDAGRVGVQGFGRPLRPR